jgi:hypothetical protein
MNAPLIQITARPFADKPSTNTVNARDLHAV